MLDNRFWSKVRAGSEQSCWEWTANKNNKGYGLFRPGGSAPKRLAHRLSYEDAFGPITAGALVLHECDNPSCVNPRHLRLGGHKENVADMDARGRRVVNPMKGELNANAKTTAEEVDAIRRAYLSATPIEEIKAAFGVTQSHLQDIVCGRSWKHLLGVGGSPSLADLKRENRRRMANNALLTPDQVSVIKRSLANGGRIYQIAAQFNVSRTTIADIKAGRTWRSPMP